MSKLLIGFGLTLVAFGQGQNINGNWTGSIAPGGTTLHFEVQFEGTSGKWNSVDQGASIPVKAVSLTGRAVAVDLGIAKFEGVLNESAEQIAGTFRQGGAAFPLTLSRYSGTFRQPDRPQDPVRPFPYAETEVTVTSGDVVLAGTLTVPKSGGPFPAALLISGSGAQDRNEALMGHRPFLVLSDSLTRAGFAVLRLDDRGTGHSTGDFSKASYADKTADVQAAVQFLKSRTEIDAKKIGVIGHSEGGTIGPMAAAASHDIAFVVMMAGMGIPGPELLKQQGIDVTRAAGGDDAAVARQVEIQSKIFAIYREGGSAEQRRVKIRQIIANDAEADRTFQSMESLTFREILSLDPAAILRKLSCPVLAINGSLDTQVSAQQNLPAIAAALAASASKDWQVAELPGLNHLFQTAKTGGLGEYRNISETIAPVVLRTLNEWLTLRFLTRK